MMVQTITTPQAERHTVSVEAFDALIAQPEYRSRDWEHIAGEMVEKMVSNSLPSRIAAYIVGVLFMYQMQHRSGWVTGADGGYWVNGDRFIPDAAYVSYARQPEPPNVAYNPLAPDLAVEVLSEGNSADEIRKKMFSYQAAGTVLWLVDPVAEQIEVYTPGATVVTLRGDAVLDGGAVLPGFTLALRDLFAAAPPAPSA